MNALHGPAVLLTKHCKWYLCLLFSSNFLSQIRWWKQQFDTKANKEMSLLDTCLCYYRRMLHTLWMFLFDWILYPANQVGMADAIDLETPCMVTVLATRNCSPNFSLQTDIGWRSERELIPLGSWWSLKQYPYKCHLWRSEMNSVYNSMKESKCTWNVWVCEPCLAKQN